MFHFDSEETIFIPTGQIEDGDQAKGPKRVNAEMREHQHCDICSNDN